MAAKSCDQPCGPGDFYEGGYCDLHGCFKSLSDQFRERLEKYLNKWDKVLEPIQRDLMILEIMDEYNKVHQ